MAALIASVSSIPLSFKGFGFPITRCPITGSPDLARGFVFAAPPGQHVARVGSVRRLNGLPNFQCGFGAGDGCRAVAHTVESKRAVEERAGFAEAITHRLCNLELL